MGHSVDMLALVCYFGDAGEILLAMKRLLTKNCSVIPLYHEI